MTAPLTLREKLENAGKCEGTCVCPRLSTAEVAEWLEVPARTIERWRYRRNGPPSVRVGNAVRYAPCQVVTWWEALDEGEAS